jgi:hypothetical protein
LLADLSLDFALEIEVVTAVLLPVTLIPSAVLIEIIPEIAIKTSIAVVSAVSIEIAPEIAVITSLAVTGMVSISIVPEIAVTSIVTAISGAILIEGDSGAIEGSNGATVFTLEGAI